VGFILPLVLLLLWEAATHEKWVKPYFLPSPENVARTFWSMLTQQELLKDLRLSSTIILEGFVSGTAVGLILGFAAGLSRTTETFLAPTLNAVRQVPPLAWIPLLVLWLGIGPIAKGVLVAKAVFFPVFLNTVQGIRAVSKDYIEVGRVFGYGRMLMLRRIILPSALPMIFVGIRYGAGLAWSVMIAAEMIGSKYGIGYLLMRAQELLLTTQLYVVIAIIGSVGFAIDFVLRAIESRLLHWRRSFEG
jgi:sulfonate transport system permease protein